jgi:ribosome-binding factor A
MVLMRWRKALRKLLMDLLRRIRFKRLSIHTIPRLHFLHDTSVEHGFAINRLIAEAVGDGDGSVEKPEHPKE